MKQWHFYEPVFRRWVVLMIGPLEDYRAELEHNGFKYMEVVVDCNGSCTELTPENNTAGQNCTIIWMKEFNLATLIHEITHMVMMCLDQVLVPISRDNTETFAFYTEYWFTQMTKARRKWPTGNKPKDARQ